MKKDIQLSSEDVIDLTPEELNAWDIKVIPFLCEDASTPLADLYKKLAETGEPMLVSAPKVAQFEEHFYDLLSNAEHIIHFSASSYLSAGYNSAVVASHENSNITVIDTHGNSGAIALLAFYARDLISMGYGYKEIVALLLERRDRIERSFLCESIAVLGAYRMIPKKSLFAAKLFKTRAEFVYGTEGELRFGKRYHGSLEKCLRKFVVHALKSNPNIDRKRVFFSASDISNGIKEICMEIAKDAGFEEIRFEQSCRANAYCAGPNAIGIYFFVDGPHPIPKKG